MTKNSRDILVTSALLYANGPLHLGHMVELIQTDIWVRFHKMLGNRCFYLGGDDAHGTPIMISSEKQGISPETLINQIGQEHQADIQDFLVKMDNYYTTHSAENKELVYLFYDRLKQRGDIVKRTIHQAYDPVKQMFLPDRYVKGECPRCGAKDQYGDNCEVCGATYLPSELKDPISVLSGVAPIEKASEHYFFCLEHYTDMLSEWTKAGHLQEQVSNKLSEWLSAGLEQWDISRDAPYFGFEIPDHPGKYFYVWLDAPIGYIASFKNHIEQHPELPITLEQFWGKNSKAELYHFVGKDIIYFHALFWPAMLSGAGFRTPTAVFTHGFLTVDGQKMSKSRGTFIKARTYLDHLDPQYLRYYFAAKLTNRIDDIDLNFDDFVAKANADLVGKVINIASRCAGFINKRFAGNLADSLDKPELFTQLAETGDLIAKCYEDRDYAQAVRLIMQLADVVNQYIDEQKPWVLAKEIGQEQRVQAVCTMGLNCYRLLALYLKPIMPVLAEKSEQFLNIAPLKWSDKNSALLNHSINEFTPLLSRIDPEKLAALKTAALQEAQLS